jgi:hypothetical protein
MASRYKWLTWIETRSIGQLWYAWIEMWPPPVDNFTWTDNAREAPHA